MPRQRLLLLDRDGTLLEHAEPYVLRWSDVALRPGVAVAVADAARRGWQPIVVTNQSPVARGLVGEDFVREVNAYLSAEVQLAGGPPVDVLWCPHHPGCGCRCRKPRPALLHDAAQRTGLPLHEAVYVGDSRSDLDAARAAGVPAFLHACGGAEPCPEPHDDIRVACLGELAALADALPPAGAPSRGAAVIRRVAAGRGSGRSRPSGA